MKKYFLLILFSIVCQITKAQNYFSAIVKDSLTNEPLIGATVIEKGTTNGATTDINGNVKFAVTKTGEVNFTVQFIGYDNKNFVVTIPQQETLMTILLSSNNHELEEVTVTSVRTNSRIEDIPTRIEVLGQDDLHEENGIKPGNIMSLLGDIAGIQMQQVSASSGNTYARIQGLNGRYTQLLKDGMPLFGGLSGSFGIMQIPPLDLKQIEIIKGSASTLYGGDAIGGIINLISKDPLNEPQLSFTANQTTLRETNFNGYGSKRFNKVGFTLFAGQTVQKQSDIDNDGLSDVPEVNSTVIHPKFVFYFNPKSTLTLNYTGTFETRKGGNMDYFNSEAPDSLYHIDNKVQRNSADAKWLYEFSKANNLSVKFSSSYLTQNLGTKFYVFDATQLIYYSEVSYFHKLKKTEWVGGINFNGDVFDNKSFGLTQPLDYDYQTVGGFIQNTWFPNQKLTVETGFRGDYHSKYGFFPLPRLSFMYKFNKEFTGRVNGGFGYKIPNVITYINPETDLNVITANTNLKTELSQGANADINFHKLFSDKLNVTINQSFFFTNISEPVYDSSSTASQISLVNANKSLQTQGLQTYARIKYSFIELYLGYVYTDVLQLYKNENRELPVTPKHNFSSVLFFEPGDHWRFGIESSLIAGQVDENYIKVKNYLLFAAMIQYNVGSFSFVLNGENLLDFRQNKIEKIYDGDINNPVFHDLWAPIDGRVINLSVKWSLPEKRK
jgi:outer membrane receptor for ferrienterochelin and colicins